MKHKITRGIQQFLRWLFGAPIQDLPPEFGDTVPSELRVFEAEAEERQQQHRYGQVSTSTKSDPSHGSEFSPK
jgi:hypothetical protein